MISHARVLLPCVVLCTFAAAADRAGHARPSVAPAPGWQQQHGPVHIGYTGRRWTRDYGIFENRCDRHTISTIVGESATAPPGSLGKSTAVAMLVGTAAGGAVGSMIGRDMARADRACMGHALELAGNHRPVRWESPRRRTEFTLTPLRGYVEGGRACRAFSVHSSRERHTSLAHACRTGEGVWALAP